MSNVPALKKHPARPPAAKGMRETEDGLSAIAAAAEDLCAEIRDVGKVVDVDIGRRAGNG